MKSIRFNVSVWVLLIGMAGCIITLFSGVVISKTVLTVMDWRLNETKQTQQWFQWLKEKFEAEHPGVEIKYVTSPLGTEYKNKLILGAASGTGPDIARLSIMHARDLFEQGILIPLNNFIERSPEVAPDKMFPATQVYNHKEGKIFGVTYGMVSSCLLYDMDAFEEAGLDTDPVAISSWTQFISAAQKLTRNAADGTVKRWGFSMGLAPESYASWLTANGGSFYDAKSNRAGFNDQAGIQTAEFLNKLVFSYKVVGGDFQKGTAAMGYGNSSAPYFIADINPRLRFSITSFPPGPMGNGRRGCLTWGNMLSITKTCKHAELAWDYIRYYTSLQGNLNEFRFIPTVISPRRDFYTTPEWKTIEARFKWAAMLPKIALEGGVYPYIHYEEMFERVWRPLLYPALAGQKPIESSLKEAERIYNMLLAEK